MTAPSSGPRRRLARFVREHPRLYAAVHPPYLHLRRLLRRRELNQHGAVRGAHAGNGIIRDAILSGGPHGIAKIGSLEAEALSCFLGQTGYPPLLMEQLVTNVGLFPGTPDSIDRFCAAYLAALAQIDLLAVWGQPGEAELLRRAPAALTGTPRELLHIDSFEPWYHPDPWSGALAGKRVVVLHPFAATIERQYARRRDVWGTRGILPDCDLRTVRMPLSPALVPAKFGHWQEQFGHLVGEIESRPYDVLIAGAGGISLPVAALACARGKVGFHMGRSHPDPVRRPGTALGEVGVHHGAAECRLGQAQRGGGADGGPQGRAGMLLVRPSTSLPIPRLRRVVGRALARRCARRLAVLSQDFVPTVSFTFDDFPASAVDMALPILEAAGMTATWYAASGLFGQPSDVGTVATADQLSKLHAAGQEIGDHTRRHLDARAVAALDYGRDIDENRRVLTDLLPGLAVRSFAYPFGAVTVGAKRAAMTRAVTCRSTMAGIARGSVDLALLPANPLYGGAASLAAAQDVIGRLRAVGGWAIFYTHDVAQVPSPWGCTPASFAAIVAAVGRAGLRVRTVGAVAGEILRQPA